MTDPSKGTDVPPAPIVELRLQMASEGWESQDRMSAAGWRAGIGYSIWFERSDWHGHNTFHLTGNRATYHAHVGPPLDQASMLRAAKKAAAIARQAYESFRDYPPQQTADSSLKVCRIPLPTTTFTGGNSATAESFDDKH